MATLVSPRHSDQRRGAIAASSVIAASAIGAALYSTDSTLLLWLFMAIGAFAAFLIAYVAPGLVFAAFLATPFYKAGLQSFLPVDITVALGILCAIQPAFMMVNHQRSGASSPFMRRARNSVMLWLLFSAMVVVGTLYSPDKGAAREITLAWVLLTILPALAAIRIAKQQKYIRQFLWGLIGVGTAVVIVGLWLLPQVGEWPNDRLRVFDTHTIRVGQSALLVPLIAISFIRRNSSGIPRLFAMALIPFALLVSASSGSRGPLIMLLVTTVVFGLRRVVLLMIDGRRRPQTVRPLRILIPTAFVFVLLLVVPFQGVTSLVPDRSAERLSSIAAMVGQVEATKMTEYAPDTSAEGRLIAYEFAEEMFVERPFIGHGTFSFATLSYREETRLDWLPEDAHPHNIILQIASEFGLVGLFVFVAITATAFWRGLRVSRSIPWTTVAVLAVFFQLCALVSTDMYDNRMLWCLLLLLLLAPDPSESDGPEPRFVRAES